MTVNVDATHCHQRPPTVGIRPDARAPLDWLTDRVNVFRQLAHEQ